MYKIYFKQAFALLRENKLLSLVSVLGTALAISMIMVIVIVWQVRTASYAPETNRDRMLYVKNAMATYIEKKDWNSSFFLSSSLIKRCLYPLKDVEAVGMACHFQQRLAGLPDHTVEFKADVTFTDAAFWRVFEFGFLAGKPYTEEEVLSGIRNAVVCESVARRLYGTTDVVGREVQISYVPYTIRAVVGDVSMLAESAYGNIWVPYSTDEVGEYSQDDDLLGGFYCYILAKDRSSFDSIRKETDENVRRLNAGQAKEVVSLVGAPDTHFTQMIRGIEWEEPDVTGKILRYALIIAILLLIPAINMSGMTLSRMRKRMSEIGVRKAFGATQQELVGQVLWENMLTTLVGGVVGLVFSYGAIFVLGSWLLDAGEMSGYQEGTAFVNAEMMLNPLIFALAFIFCLLMNLLSAGIPAWRASRMNIVDALNEK